MMKAKKKDLEKMYFREKKTLREIGEHYGVCRERVRQVMVKFGLSPNPKRRGGIPLKKRNGGV